MFQAQTSTYFCIFVWGPCANCSDGSISSYMEYNTTTLVFLSVIYVDNNA